MNVAPPGSSLPSARGDDTQGMRRHLLQDLERQWLDAWRVVDHAQSDAGAERQSDLKPPASTASASARLTDNRGAATNERDIEPATSRPRATVEADQPASVRRVATESDAPSTTPSHAHDNRPRADASAASVSQAATSSAQQAQTDRPEAVATDTGREQGMSNQQADAQQAATNDVREAIPVMALPVFANANFGQSPIGEPASFSLLTTPSMDARMATATSLEQPGHVAELAPVGSGRAPTGGAPNTSKTLLEDGPENGTSGANRQAKALPPALDDQGPQRIMLRELSDQEVLASMRDTFLTPTQSQFAAQGLARALMEAGYARVQVVVNGKPALTTHSSASPRMGDHPPGAQPITASQDKHHGH